MVSILAHTFDPPRQLFDRIALEWQVSEAQIESRKLIGLIKLRDTYATTNNAVNQ